MIILGTNSIKDTGFDVANSCRFDDGSSAYMHKTPGSAGDQQKFTFSFWIKRCALATGTAMTIFDTEADDDNQFKIRFNDNGTLTVESKVSDHNDSLITTQLFRDPSAWSNFVIAFDTTQGTASNRVKIYHNGTQITSFGTENYPAEDLNTLVNAANKLYVGTSAQTDAYCDMYIAEFCLVDGQQLAATSFGEFDEDSPRIWKPKDVSGLTFGTNGFYLDFEDSANLGNDANGGTDLTEVNLAATDQTTDTPTNNFCTLNSLDGGQQDTTLSEGNLKIDAGGSASWGYNAGTFHVSSGKWFWEMKVLVDNPLFFGVVESENTSFIHKANVYPYKNYGGFAVYSSSSQGQKQEGTTDGRSTYQSSQSVNDIMGIALDLDNNRLYTSKNGQWSDGSGNNDEASPNAFLDLSSNLSVTNPSGWRPIFSMDNNADVSVNFGNPAFSISSGNSDANGYGNFEYAPPSGYYALCTKNLAEYGG